VIFALAVLVPGGALSAESFVDRPSGSVGGAASGGPEFGGGQGTGPAAFGDAVDHGSLSGTPLARPVVGMTATPSGAGYQLVAADGGVFSFGDARFFGSTGALTLNKPIVGLATTPSGNGYWLVAADGGIFAFGDAPFLGSTGAMTLNKPIVGLAPAPSGNGYWLVASDGGIFSFGDAPFFGSTGGMALLQPITGLAATPSGDGYWLVAADGGIFSFGDAPFHGSDGGGGLGQPVVAIASNADGSGYWLAGAAGRIAPHGDVPGFQATYAPAPVVGMAPTPSGHGYWLATSAGDVLSAARPAPPAPSPAPVAPEQNPPAPTPPVPTPPNPGIPAPAGGPALGAYVPAYAGGPDGLVRFGNAVGRPVTNAMVYMDAHTDWETFTNQSWLLDPWADWLRADPARRVVLAVPMLQVGSDGDFYNSSYDQYFVRLARSIRDRGVGSQVIIRLGYEMNGEWMPWGRQYSPDGSGFRAMWRRIVPQMKAVYPLVFDWNITGGGQPGTPGYGENFYPGDDVVDVIAFDLYDHWWSGNPDERWQQTQAALDAGAAIAYRHGKRMAIDEWGLWSTDNSQGGGDNPTYITNMLRWADSHHLLWTSYFNSTEGSVNTLLEHNPNGLNAFRQVLAYG
jgi:hypothetical protein